MNKCGDQAVLIEAWCDYSVSNANISKIATSLDQRCLVTYPSQLSFESLTI